MLSVMEAIAADVPFGHARRDEVLSLKTRPKRVASKPHRSSPKVAHTTTRGIAYRGLAEEVLRDPTFRKQYRHKVQLIFTSPPFPLNRKKKYGNLQGERYIEWLASFAPIFREFLRPNGSIVMEIGNAWQPGSPVMSTLALEALLAFVKKGGLHLCQQFICHNPARLPSPAQWVTVKRVRVKDSYTHLWWMSPTEHPKADNRKVLREYSPSMLKLLKRKMYNSGRRPSQHSIGKESFFTDNKGAIPPNVLTFSNTKSNDEYQEHCRRLGLMPHPARMPAGLPQFFIKFLTGPRSLVLDPFAGSNTTGAVAEQLKRRWVAIEPDKNYLKGSKGRFTAEEKRA